MTAFTTRSRGQSLIGLIAWLGLAFCAAAVGAVASVDAGTFYSQLQRPAWAPPGWLFGPVWTVLYAMMGVSAWLVWCTQAGASMRRALVLFSAQLAVNALWSWLFFAWHQGALAFLNILVLWVLLVATLIGFWRLRSLAAWLLVPYLLWVGFAGLLNFAIWQANPALL
ncbi:tryptophan-rich sensory protein [Spongiibacter taiwanensis]|uniref:TspO/MBR family protein n=1 Tax=Spongiibacter taiwanensis TaxID=1748242 RepID=UPI0020363BAC|nr:TspO/MBR family protein [Spongiibacter taiwanensis]USA41884.1 tryptophan-rich sensory protein [Spongiibacter taiwanensis]